MKRWMIGLLAAFALPYFGYLFALAPLSHLNQVSFAMALMGVLYFKWTGSTPACNATTPAPAAPDAPSCCDNKS